MKKHNNLKQTVLVSRNNFDLVKTFCIIDDFFSLIRVNGVGRKPNLNVSELVTISLIGSIYEISCIKRLYELVRDRFDSDFPLLSEYNNFLIGIHKIYKYMLLFINLVLSLRNTTNSDVCFVDGTKLPVCKIYREKSHRVMKSLATKSKSTTGWWYGLKLHLVCDRQGNLMKLRITTATTSERQILDSFLDELFDSILVADGGYVSKALDLKANGNNNIPLSAKRKNMKTLATLWQNKCMNMRSRVETVFDVLKEKYNLVISLPRSVNGYLSHYVRCLFGYMVIN